MPGFNDPHPALSITRVFAACGNIPDVVALPLYLDDMFAVDVDEAADDDEPRREVRVFVNEVDGWAGHAIAERFMLADGLWDAECAAKRAEFDLLAPPSPSVSG